MSIKKKSGYAALICFGALVLVCAISFMPLEKWTNGRLKDFNLVSDILPDSLLPVSDAGKIEDIDPELLKAQQEDQAVASTRDADGNALYIDTIVGEAKPLRVGDEVVIEDYTTGEVGLYHLKRALADGCLARITVVGDSYIEGDIFTQDLRERLQTTYGGKGVGFVSMHSDFPGFRQSVKQGGQGWKEFAAGKGADNKYVGLSEHYYMPTGNALATYTGTEKVPHCEGWTRSTFMFISPNNTTVMVKTDGNWTEHPVTGSTAVQTITIDGATSEFDIKVTDTRLVGLGVWLDTPKGISVDCMSSRGFSGIVLNQLDVDLCHEMSKSINYDLIILEFGINAMSASQKNYSVYCNRMVQVINHVRACYPDADVLLMGIGDRGEKKGSIVKSMSTAPAMIAAQREAARRAHCLFWDTREAMGGEDAIVRWAADGRVNKDYIHLTHKGGKELAGYLYNALQRLLKQPVTVQK